MVHVADSDEIAGELYLVPPTRFVAARDELVRQARAAGHPELARELRLLRRPARSAWLVNLLTRHERAPLERLMALGRELRQAQTGLDEKELRRLSRLRQQMIDDLLDRARDHGAEAGVRPNEASLAEVEGTLRAGLVDVAASATVLSGRLVRPMAHSGLGPMPHPDMPAVRASPRREATIPDEEERSRSAWPVQHSPAQRAPQPGPRRHLTSLSSQSQDVGQGRPSRPAAPADDPAEGVRRAEAQLAEAESLHWQREQELALDLAAAEAARDRVEWLGRQRLEARSERVTADRRVAEARAAQRAAVRAVAEGWRALEAAERRLRSTDEQTSSDEADG